MRVFILGGEATTSLGFSIARRLLADGHSVSALVSSSKGTATVANAQIAPITGDLKDSEALRELGLAEVVIDARILIDTRMRELKADRALLVKQLEGTGRVLIASSSMTVLGDTGKVPIDEKARISTPHSSSWLRGLERKVLRAKSLRGVVIRPAMTYGRGVPPLVLPLVSLALRFKRGVYIGQGTNRRSAVHCDDLADLYCLAFQRPSAGLLVHAASETFSMRELAQAIHNGLRLKGEPSSLPLREARMLTPFARGLTKNSAISGDLARRALTWEPKRPSLLQEVESNVMKWMGRG